MRFTPAPLAGGVLIRPPVFTDARGYFLETWREREFAENGIDARFVQENHSQSIQWTLRGMHFQIEHAQGKLVRVAQGSVFDAVVDLRRSSATFGRWWAVELSGQNHHMLWVPPGLAHGILALSPMADLIYKCTDVYSPIHERTLRWDDPAIGIQWPLPPGVRPRLSPKDAVGTAFSAIDTFS